MGAHRSSYRPTLPSRPRRFKICSQPLPLGGKDSVTGAVYRRRPNWCPSTRRCFSLSETPPELRSRSRLSVQQQRKRSGGNPPNGNGCANRQSSRIRAMITSRFKRRASITTSTTRIWPGFAFKPTPVCRPPIPIRSIRSSTPSRRSHSIHSPPATRTSFLQKLVNYFNPAFSWYQSLFGPAIFQKTLALSHRASGQRRERALHYDRRPDNTWVQGRRATRFFINDNLAWTDRRARTPVRHKHANFSAERL